MSEASQAQSNTSPPPLRRRKRSVITPSSSSVCVEIDLIASFYIETFFKKLHTYIHNRFRIGCRLQVLPRAQRRASHHQGCMCRSWGCVKAIAKIIFTHIQPQQNKLKAADKKQLSPQRIGRSKQKRPSFMSVYHDTAKEGMSKEELSHPYTATIAELRQQQQKPNTAQVLILRLYFTFEWIYSLSLFSVINLWIHITSCLFLLQLQKVMGLDSIAFGGSLRSPLSTRTNTVMHTPLAKRQSIATSSLISASGKRGKAFKSPSVSGFARSASPLFSTPPMKCMCSSNNICTYCIWMCCSFGHHRRDGSE